MIQLAEVEERLGLFTEGIVGKYLHIRGTTDTTEPYQTTDALYFPEQIDASNLHVYHVLALQQIGQRECGTFAFNLEKAKQHIPSMPSIQRTVAREGDLTLFFKSFTHPSVARQLFSAYDLIRINAHIQRTYPGAIKYMSLAEHADLSTPTFEPNVEALCVIAGYEIDNLTKPGATVYDSAAATLQTFPLLQLDMLVTAIVTEEVSGIEWMQREARLEDWQDEEAQLSNQVLAVEMLESEAVDALESDNVDGEVREQALDIAQLAQERDTLKRRIDMERAALRHAVGPPREDARSYRYDEWDMHQRAYLRKHCTLYEQRLAPDAEANLDKQREVVRAWLGAVKPQLEQIRPAGLQRVKRVLDGDELDMNAVIEARQDTRARVTPDERIYSRRERVHRDVCALFLVDLSASTDDPIEPPELPELDEWGDPVNLRDPFEDHPMFADIDEPLPDSPRKIIDIQREAMLVMGTALDMLGDSFGVYGFSGYGHDCVEVFVAKEIGEAFSATTLRTIASMAPKRSTRMGPAIRHSTAKLIASGHAMKVLIVVSDGFPQDCDYGPDRSDHEYGLIDTAKALQEAEAKGVETFCITVDRSGHDYLKRMCPESRYMVIEEMEDLPQELSKVYGALTAR